MSKTTSDSGRIFGQGLLVAILFLSIIHNFLFLYRGVGLNYPLFIILLAGYVVWLSCVRTGRVLPIRVGLASLSVVFASFVVINASDVLVFFNIVASLALLALTVQH